MCNYFLCQIPLRLVYGIRMSNLDCIALVNPVALLTVHSTHNAEDHLAIYCSTVTTWLA